MLGTEFTASIDLKPGDVIEYSLFAACIIDNDRWTSFVDIGLSVDDTRLAQIYTADMGFFESSGTFVVPEEGVFDKITIEYFIEASRGNIIRFDVETLKINGQSLL